MHMIWIILVFKQTEQNYKKKKDMEKTVI